MSQHVDQRPGRPSCFSNRLENTLLVEDVEILLSTKVNWVPFSGFRAEVENLSANQRPGRPLCFSDRPEIPFSGFRGEVENVSANQRPGRPLCFSDRPEKHKIGRGHCGLAFQSSFVEFCSAVSEENSKMFQPIRDKGGHLVFPIGPKSTNVAEDVEMLLPAKFRLAASEDKSKMWKINDDGRRTDNAWSQKYTLASAQVH